MESKLKDGIESLRWNRICFGLIEVNFCQHYHCLPMYLEYETNMVDSASLVTRNFQRVYTP